MKNTNIVDNIKSLKSAGRVKKINSLGVFDIIIYILLGIAGLLCIFPFLYVLIFSITPYLDYLKEPFNLIPKNPTLLAYKYITSVPLIYSGYKITHFITIVGTFLNVLLVLISAYPLSKKDLKGRNVILSLITFTMFFGGGMIPNYYLERTLGLLNSPWALILPGAISAWYLIIMKNFINTIPDSLEESAVIDGANEIIVLFKIIFPLSAPAIATFALFYAVGHWNSYFNAILYITKREYWPLTLILREIVIENDTNVSTEGVGDIFQLINPFNIKMAVIIITILPIIMVYPFLQRFFIKGMLIGSIKG